LIDHLQFFPIAHDLFAFDVVSSSVLLVERLNRAAILALSIAVLMALIQVDVS
jgi:hypothetical protein